MSRSKWEKLTFCHMTWPIQCSSWFRVHPVWEQRIQAENVFAALQDVLLLDLLVFYKQGLNVCTLAKVQSWSWPEGSIFRCLRQILGLTLVAELYMRSIHCLMFHKQTYMICSAENTSAFTHVETQCGIDTLYTEAQKWHEQKQIIILNWCMMYDNIKHTALQFSFFL